jgi:hypothetical protein
VCGKEEGFFSWVCHVFTITATGSPGCVWRTIDLYFFFRFMDELRMDYYFTTNHTSFTCYWLSKRRRLDGLLGWWERNDWEGGFGSV